MCTWQSKKEDSTIMSNYTNKLLIESYPSSKFGLIHIHAFGLKKHVFSEDLQIRGHIQLLNATYDRYASHKKFRKANKDLMTEMMRKDDAIRQEFDENLQNVQLTIQATIHIVRANTECQEEPEDDSESANVKESVKREPSVSMTWSRRQSVVKLTEIWPLKEYTLLEQCLSLVYELVTSCGILVEVSKAQRVLFQCAVLINT
uniref:Uncharacterized protein n=1 Tax=Ditylenchus dipsaci TaxID=166011 RepID=A0A915DSB5_9BILA